MSEGDAVASALIQQEDGAEPGDRVRVLRLARPPVNALNPELMSALREAIAAAVQDDRSAIVLTGAPGLFSAGLDVPELLGLGGAPLRAAWQLFFALLEDLARCPIPVGAALSGHSPAGGTVLALFADHRVLADGAQFRIGLNEVQVGLPVPAVLLRALTFLCGERHAARLAIGGWLVDPAEALRVGLVDELAPVEEVLPRTLAWAKTLGTRPVHALRATRALARKPLHDAFAQVGDGLIDEVMAQWSSAETQAVLRALAARLGKPRG